MTAFDSPRANLANSRKTTWIESSECWQPYARVGTRRNRISWRMTMNRTSLALQAAKAALTVRQRLHINATSPVCVWDAARALGIAGWFVDAPSLEGMYVQGKPPTILIGTRRPTGRQAMTCAHEIGHHAFQHGSQVDEYLASDKAEGRTPEEFLA